MSVTPTSSERRAEENSTGRGIRKENRESPTQPNPTQFDRTLATVREEGNVYRIRRYNLDFVLSSNLSFVNDVW